MSYSHGTDLWPSLCIIYREGVVGDSVTVVVEVAVEVEAGLVTEGVEVEAAEHPVVVAEGLAQVVSQVSRVRRPLFSSFHLQCIVSIRWPLYSSYLLFWFNYNQFPSLGFISIKHEYIQLRILDIKVVHNIDGR